METVISTSSSLTTLKNSAKANFYAVYDSCVINGIPSWDLAFIEERNADIHVFDISAGDEKHFVSLTEAKNYVKNHFRSEAEYFSLSQCNEPDSFLHILLDKLTYMIA